MNESRVHFGGFRPSSAGRDRREAAGAGAPTALRLRGRRLPFRESRGKGAALEEFRLHGAPVPAPKAGPSTPTARRAADHTWPRSPTSPLPAFFPATAPVHAVDELNPGIVDDEPPPDPLPGREIRDPANGRGTGEHGTWRHSHRRDSRRNRAGGTRTAREEINLPAIVRAPSALLAEETLSEPDAKLRVGTGIDTAGPRRLPGVTTLRTLRLPTRHPQRPTAGDRRRSFRRSSGRPRRGHEHHSPEGVTG